MYVQSIARSSLVPKFIVDNLLYHCYAVPPPLYFAFTLSCSPTRQAVSVWIKNRVASSYSAEPARVGPDHKPISHADRSALKSNILPLLAASPSRAITVQLASTLKTLISNDFPERWPELLNSAKALLTSINIREVGAGTVVVLEMVRAFRCAPSFACFLPVAS
jgi:hypothetical protein